MLTRTFFDTNVLVYMFDSKAPAKQERAQDLFDQAAPGEAVISTQVLKELFVTLTRKLARPLPQEQALALLVEMSELPVVGLDPSMIVEGARLSMEHTLSFWDSLILVAARSAGCRTVLSEDLQHGRRILDLEIQNPFADL